MHKEWGLSGKRDFIYKPETYEYECPGGKRTIYRLSDMKKVKPADATGHLPVLIAH